MIRPKYRNIIPNEQDEKKSKDKSTYSETYEIGGMDSKVKFTEIFYIKLKMHLILK